MDVSKLNSIRAAVASMQLVLLDALDEIPNANPHEKLALLFTNDILMKEIAKEVEEITRNV